MEPRELRPEHEGDRTSEADGRGELSERQKEWSVVKIKPKSDGREASTLRIVVCCWSCPPWTPAPWLAPPPCRPSPGEDHTLPPALLGLGVQRKTGDPCAGPSIAMDRCASG